MSDDGRKTEGQNDLSTSANDNRPALLEARDLCKVYIEGNVRTRVLEGLDISIPERSFTAIVGESGVGKSTLLHLLGLIDTPTGGCIHYAGGDTAGLKHRRRAEIRNRHFGFVFQAYHLVNELMALENVLLPAMLVAPWQWFRVRRERIERARRLLERVGLAERQRHRPLALSGGERQRVAIARALMNQPAVLFCDEPTGNLDEKTSQNVFELIYDLHQQEQLTLVLVTHEARYAERADLLYRISGGKAERLR